MATRKNAVKDESDIEHCEARYQLVATACSCLSNMRSSRAGCEHGQKFLVEDDRPISEARGDVACLHLARAADLACTMLTATVIDFA